MPKITKRISPVRKVVISSWDPRLALMTAFDTTELFDYGYQDGDDTSSRFYIKEKYEDAFDKLDEGVYLYGLDPLFFERYKDLPEEEFLSFKSARIVNVIRVDNVYQMLTKLRTKFIYERREIE